MQRPRYRTVTAAARELGVPVAWLAREVRDERLPHLRAGRRVLVAPDDIAEALRQRAAANNTETVPCT